MIVPSPDWTLYRSFLAVMREGSLSRAARRLGTSQPTIGRHIDALERALGVSLFTRFRHGLTVTPVALDLVPHAEAIEAAADALVRAASGEEAGERGCVRLTASEVMGAEALPAMLTGFRAAHPGIDIELVLSNRTQDLLRREADIAVRHVRPAQEGLVARRIGTVTIGLYAHHRYLEVRGVPVGVAELSGHTLIGWDSEFDSARRAVAAFGLSRERFALRSDSHLAQLALLRAGFGIGACQRPIARRSADLVPILTDEIAFDLEVWLVTHEGLRASRRVRLLFDHLATAFSAYVGDGEMSSGGVA